MGWFLFATAMSLLAVSGWLGVGGRDDGLGQTVVVHDLVPGSRHSSLSLGTPLDVTNGSIDLGLGRSLAEYRRLLRVESADDVALLAERAEDAGPIRAASAVVDGGISGPEGAGQANAPNAEANPGEPDGTPQGADTGQVGDGLFRVTHYFGARVPFGDGGGYANAMACFGELPDFGAVAGIRAYCGRRIRIGDFEFTFKDTGGALGPRNVDVFCVSPDCADWACTKPCPEFADWEEVEWR